MTEDEIAQKAAQILTEVTKTAYIGKPLTKKQIQTYLGPSEPAYGWVQGWYGPRFSKAGESSEQEADKS